MNGLANGNGVSGAKILAARAAISALSLSALQNLLRLPEGNQITATSISSSGNHLLLRIEGPDMPLPKSDGEPEFSAILCRVEQREAEDAGTEYRTMAWFAHAPLKTWVMRDWSSAK